MKTLLLLSLIALTGCATKVKILDASAVSMTHANVPANATLVETGDVSGQFCPDTFGDSGQVGLLDEAIKDAQKKSGADFITNAAFWRENGNCITISGTGQKLQTAASAPAKAKAKK